MGLLSLKRNHKSFLFTCNHSNRADFSPKWIHTDFYFAHSLSLLNTFQIMLRAHLGLCKLPVHQVAFGTLGASLPTPARKLHFFPETLTISSLLRYLTCSFSSINPKQFQIQCCDLLILPCLTLMLPVPRSGFILYLPSPLFSLSLSPLSAALVFVLRLPHVLPVMTALMADTFGDASLSLSLTPLVSVTFTCFVKPSYTHPWWCCQHLRTSPGFHILVHNLSNERLELT